MGAYSFEDQAKGTSMKEAFLAAREEALYMNGHGGYTGTLAEKDGFVELKIPGVDGATTVKWLNEYIQAKYRAFDRDEPGNFDVNDPTTRPDGLPLNSPPPYAGHEVALERAWQAYDDKWGPAVGIHLKDDLYHFCGYASA